MLLNGERALSYGGRIGDPSYSGANLSKSLGRIRDNLIETRDSCIERYNCSYIILIRTLYDTCVERPAKKKPFFQKMTTFRILSDIQIQFNNNARIKKIKQIILRLIIVETRLFMFQHLLGRYDEYIILSPISKAISKISAIRC